VTLLDRTGTWLVTAYSASDQQLSLARIVFAASMLFLIGVPSFEWIAGTPDIFFNPPILSLANLLDAWPPPFVFYLLSVGVLVGFVLLLFGIATRVVSVALGVMLLIGFNLTYSFGKIDHSILVALAPIVMSISGWGNRYRLFPGRPLVEDRGRNSAALAILAILIGFGMLSAVLPKIRGGWLDPSTQAVYAIAIDSYYNLGSQDLLAWLPRVIDAPWLWELADYAAVAFEGLFIFSVRSPHVFRAFLFLAVQFHVVNVLLLNIWFTLNLAVYALFVRWQPLLERVRLPAWGHAGPLVRTLALGATLVLVAGVWLSPHPSVSTLLLAWFAAEDGIDAETLVVALAWVVAFYLAWRAVSRVRLTPTPNR
jgi:uncharacterized membrane protein YphA (DoxX/SURF4 family)